MPATWCHVPAAGACDERTGVCVWRRQTPPEVPSPTLVERGCGELPAAELVS